jgi:hypothetical protein
MPKRGGRAKYRYATGFSCQFLSALFPISINEDLIDFQVLEPEKILPLTNWSGAVECWNSLRILLNE